MIRVLQLNCGRVESVMNALGVVARENGINVCLLREPLVRNSRVVGLSAGMNVFNNEWAVIMVDSNEIDMMCVKECTNECAVCVRINIKKGPMYGCTIYCKFNRKTEPYLEYLERVIDCANGRPLIVGMDRPCAIAKLLKKQEKGRRKAIC